MTENNEEDIEAYEEIKLRIGRKYAKQHFFISPTNPDSPGHWVYKKFIASQSQTKHVYYSITSDNPFLPDFYLKQLKRDLDPKLARRMIYGEWIEIADETVYYAYKREKNFVNSDYNINLTLPLHISFDFNIGHGKPFSSCTFQYLPNTDEFHFFDQVVVETMRTAQAMDEWQGKGYFDLNFPQIIINGDASGKHRDTRSNVNDYDIIKKYLANYVKKDGGNINFSIDVPTQNPEIRRRHNTVNAYCENMDGEHRIKVYKKAYTVDEGLRLTKLKKGGQYVESEDRYQHITTAVGYGILQTIAQVRRKEQRTVRL